MKHKRRAFGKLASIHRAYRYLYEVLVWSDIPDGCILFRKDFVRIEIAGECERQWISKAESCRCCSGRHHTGFLVYIEKNSYQALDELHRELIRAQTTFALDEIPRAGTRRVSRMSDFVFGFTVCRRSTSILYKG
ncbi:hypothetical protein M569_11038 [Genlisea aurea]|uniref:Uncharacterized protein n=1 Tax=Genlisea aurea TaxID=192259 RepID=S8CGM7_9LAMI|nr:hypothetical protein M569_11038 [Genlisea aurea]